VGRRTGVPLIQNRLRRKKIVYFDWRSDPASRKRGEKQKSKPSKRGEESRDRARGARCGKSGEMRKDVLASDEKGIPLNMIYFEASWEVFSYIMGGFPM